MTTTTMRTVRFGLSLTNRAVLFGLPAERLLQTAELAAMGVLSKDRAARLEEGIELLRLFWGREPVTFEGRFYQFEEVESLPKPVQERIPIIIAVNPPVQSDEAIVERALRRVARL